MRSNNAAIRILNGWGKYLLGAIALAALMPSAQATISFQNGSFATNTGVGQVGFNTSITGWTGAGYTFLYSSPTQATNTGDTGDSGNVKLQAVSGTLPNQGPNKNGTVAWFVGSDPQYHAPAAGTPELSQSITGLTANTAYTVGFYWAADEQSGFSGANNEGWTVSLGNSATQSTATQNPVTGWMYQTFTFTTGSGVTSAALNFFADGGPSSTEPPFVLLTDVSFNPAVPEPATWSMMLGGFGLIGFGVLKSKFRNKR